MLIIIANKAEFVLEVHHRLFQLYGSQIKHLHTRDPLSELVDTLLSHRTKNRDSAKAFDNLIEQFGSWDNVRDADVEAIKNAITPATWPEQKAPRLKEALQIITELHGSLSLDFLADMDINEARVWLEKLPGVGPKTSAAVMSFSSVRAKALPVDSHHFRVAVRLGIIDAKIGEARANRILENLLPPNFTAKEMFDNHQVMMRHGQQVCHHYNPECASCVLLDLCPMGQALTTIQT